MSAIRMRTILLGTLTLIVSTCAIPGTTVAAPGNAAPHGQKPLTRNDVDLLLREARALIQQGKFDEADRVIVRAENAHVHYSLLHFGPTPSTVRRELERARRAPGAASPTRSNGNAGEPVDPFLARSEQKQNAPGASQPGQLPESDLGAALSQTQSGTLGNGQDPLTLPRLESALRDNQVVQTGWDEVAEYQAAQQLPLHGPNAIALAPPQRPAPLDAASDTRPISEAKQDVLNDLAEARRALEAGNLELAEELSRSAASRGVPESQFLPDEDRPSLLAWDIQQHKQNQAAPAVVRALPAPAAPLTPPLSSTPAMPRAAAAATFSEEALPLPAAESVAPHRASLLDAADESQQVVARQLSNEIGKRQTEAQRLRSEDPERAVAILQEAQQMVQDSNLPESMQRELLARINITLEKTQKYIKDNAAQIELDRQNAAVLAARDRDRAMRLKLQQKIADSIEEFNRLRDEQRYAEAEIVARRLYEVAPDDPVVQQVMQTAKFIRREMLNRQVVSSREDAIFHTLHDVERATVSNVGDGRELVFDQKHWGQFVKNRKGTRDRVQRRTERELEIERRLKTPVMLRYQDTPLSEVIQGLSELAGINIHLDPRGLNQEGVNSNTPITLNLNKEITLQSALNLILEPHHLSYVIKDDVLKITSEQLRDGEIYQVVYNVADLVVPIPNFVPSSGIGLQGLINDAHSAAGYGQAAVGGREPSVLVNNRNGQRGGAASDRVLAQQFGAAPTTGVSPGTVPIGAGPGGMGGGANADFDSLIDLIVSTVSTETWAENGGGEAEIRPFPTNLSLVISQTQAVHEEIADLLEQLRRLQDLQVTIEVRFIRLNDSFFERIGIDFDMNVAANTNLPPGSLPPGSNFPGGNSQTVGITRGDPFPNFTSDLDIPFRQDSFDLTGVVPFGGPVAGGLNFGFAILSDIEAYFLIEAAQGDRRTNVLNAPKVTLFNGQQAFVADATQRPFVVGVIPVVGEFAAAQQPVIVVLNEGTMMTIQAVVSDDRRYVRMTIVPFFTQIGDVDTFTFEGTTSTNKSSSSKDDNEDKSNEKSNSEQEVRSGVTVQLPSFSFVSVVTTVSVPDGGTVLLGGIKRLSEGRNEFGVPLLSKIPYINRLFRNVSIGRETDSLMMMVTPRIIIQEEEEERLGIAVP